MTCKHEHRRIEAIPKQLGGGAVVVCMDCECYWELEDEPLPVKDNGDGLTDKDTGGTSS